MPLIITYLLRCDKCEVMHVGPHPTAADCHLEAIGKNWKNDEILPSGTMIPRSQWWCWACVAEDNERGE